VVENIWEFLEYMGVIALGKWLFSRDAAAAEVYREIICRFRGKLEKFGKHLRNSSRHPDEDYPKLLEFEPILQELNLKKRRLLFKPRFLNKSIRESLKLFSRMNTPSPANKPHMIAAELTVEWGIPTVSPYEAVKLIEMQKILERPFPIRWAYGIFSWVKPLLGKIPFRVRIEKRECPPKMDNFWHTGAQKQAAPASTSQKFKKS